MRRRPTTRMATCCPARRAVAGAGGLCKVHASRSLTLVSEAGPTPETCPHCHAEPPGWRAGPDLAHCVYCGCLWERRRVVTA